MKSTAYRLATSLVLGLWLTVAAAAAQDKREAGDMHRLARLQVAWAAQTQHWLEGFHHKVSGEALTYHSPLPYVTEAFLTRATGGTMAIAWQTAPVPADYPGEEVTFVWLAGLAGQLPEQRFDVFINDAKWFTFSTTERDAWQITGRHGARLRFRATMTDQYHDHFGFMTLTAPRPALAPGEPLEIRVVGEAAGSMLWYMVFEEDRVAELLRRGADEAFWYRLQWTERGDALQAALPEVWAGRTLRLIDHTGRSFAAALQAAGEHSQATLALPPGGVAALALPLAVQIDATPIDELERLDGVWQTSEPDAGGLLVLRDKTEAGRRHILEASGSRFLQVAEGMAGIAGSYFKGGTIRLITSSHQDIAWMDTPESCIAQRDTVIITPALDLLRQDPTFHYSAEQALTLKEYLARRPERYDEIVQYTREGRLEWGATYNQPYEGMYSGESLARQFYFGKRWLKHVLDGYEARTAWNVDVPGRTLQMPQLLSKAGVDYLVISRFAQGFYWWESPDGSRVGTYSPGHYHGASEFMRQATAPQIMAAYPRVLKAWEPLYRTHRLAPVFPVLVSSDMSSPHTYETLLDAWNGYQRQSRIATENPAPPTMHYDVMQHVLDEIFAGDPDLPVLRGERPNVWLYIHGPTHHEAVTASREAARLLTAAETFSSVEAALAGSFAGYPAQALSEAWEAQIYPDHGWGGKNGHVTDSVFQASAEQARAAGQALLDRALTRIAAQVKVRDNAGQPLVVFNALSWKRSGPVRVAVPFEPGQAQRAEIVDAQQRRVPSTLEDAVYYNDGSLQRAEVVFVAEAVPSMGYRTYYVQPVSQQPERPAAPEAGVTTYENAFYRITFAPGGIKQIYDKALEQALFRTDKFLAGELFTMRSEGNGAGEFAAVQQPTMEGFDRVSLHQPSWRMVREDTVATVFALEQDLPHVTVRQRLRVYKHIKQIDLDVALLGWDGTAYREFRLAFPLNMNGAQVSYEVPFGMVQVGKDEIQGAAGERYEQPAAEVRPREVMDFVSASDDRWGLTMSTSVAAFDYKDPTEQPVSYPVLQPLLLASRKSCHWEGNWYLQEGDHHYRFSITTHAPGWEQGYRFGKEAAQPLYAVLPTDTDRTTLPEAMSFMEIQGGRVVVSTIKKAEDEEALVVRLYEVEGKDAEITLDWFRPIASAQRVNLIEEEGSSLPVQEGRLALKVGHHAIETVKMKTP